MPVDDELVHDAKQAAARLSDCEREFDVARSDYHHAVRRLHLAGASMREIAAALDLSHQRVHQIIESAGGNGRRWKRSSSACDPKELCCSFCGLAQKKARKLVAGPGVYICNDCVPVAARVVAGHAGGAGTPTGIDAVGQDSGRHCSFCGRGAQAVGRLASSVAGAAAQPAVRTRRSSAKWVDGDDVNICVECLDLCEDIIAGRYN